jgi:RNA polymerase sigma-70 factor (ECF subfamily)
VDAEGEFEHLYERSFDVVARACRALSVSRGEAYDLAQEAFVRTWANWHKATARPDPLFYTLRIAHNLAASRLRRSKLQESFTRRHGHHGTQDEFSAHSDDALDALAAVRRLPARQRMAVVLCDLLDLEQPQAAQVMGVAPSTLRVHLSRAHRHLRMELDSRAKGERE